MRGQSRPDGTADSRPRVGRSGMTLIELMIVVSIISILGTIAIPTFQRYIRRSKTSEASMNLRRLFDSSVSYFDAEHTGSTGAIVPSQFPTSCAVSPSLALIGSAKHEPAPADWSNDTWNALNYAVADPHYFAYQYDSTSIPLPGLNNSFTATAFGNFDDDAVYSTFLRLGTIDGGGEVRGGGAVYVSDEGSTPAPPPPPPPPS